MNHKKIIQELQKQFPSKKIIKNNELDPTEIICEIDPTEEHHNYDVAIAVIDKSIKHYHKKSTEIYKIIKGTLRVYIDEKLHLLKENDELIIKPGQIHWAEGNETWVEATSYPGWTQADHIYI
jgi:mannose-6-phosphate isomerase-like protein (cupin superfamily)